MKIHEYQAATIFERAGIPVVKGQIAVTADEAVEIAQKIGYSVVLKSQVLVGGRGKAGGIKIVRDEHELKNSFGQLRELKIKGYGVEKVLVVRAIDIKKEFYIGAAVDHIRNDVVLIASASGGIDIEEVAKSNPQAIKKHYLEGKREPDEQQLRDFVAAVFEDKAQQQAAEKIFKSLAKVFFDYDCSIAEINPLVVDGHGRLLAADAKINFDDNALFRHPENEGMRDPGFEDPEEREAQEKGLSFVKLDGNVGCIVNGAGLAMGTMDVIKLSGGRPANFLDVGGSSNPEKVLHALQIILKNKDIKAVLINIFGGITRCDDIANGILQAKRQMDIPVPLVVRLTGTNEEAAKELLSKEQIKTFSTMREAVLKVVELAGEK